MGLDRNRGDHGPRRNRRGRAGRLVQHRRQLFGHAREARIQPYLDDPPFQQAVGKFGKRRLHFRQNLFGALQLDQLQLACVEPSERADGVNEKVVHLGNALDPRESAARDDKRQQPRPFRGVSGD